MKASSKKTEKTVLGEGRYLRLIDAGHWEYVERHHASGVVILIPITDRGDIVLVEQYRKPLGRLVIELPAGLVGDVAGQEDEALEVAARRELLEETGYQAEDIIALFDAPTSPGLCSELLSFFLARGLNKTGPGGGDETEDITVHTVPLASAMNWLEEARKNRQVFIDSKVYTGLYLAEYFSRMNPPLQKGGRGDFI